MAQHTHKQNNASYHPTDNVQEQCGVVVTSEGAQGLRLALKIQISILDLCELHGTSLGFTGQTTSRWTPGLKAWNPLKPKALFRKAL